VLVNGSDQTVLDVLSNRRSEQDGLLRDETCRSTKKRGKREGERGSSPSTGEEEGRKLTNLLSKPVDVQSLDVSSIELHRSGDGVVESFDESHNGGLSRSRGSDESSGVSSFEVNGQSLPVGGREIKERRSNDKSANETRILLDI